MLDRSLWILRADLRRQKLTIVVSHHCRGLGKGDLCWQ